VEKVSTNATGYLLQRGVIIHNEISVFNVNIGDYQARLKRDETAVIIENLLSRTKYHRHIPYNRLPEWKGTVTCRLSRSWNIRG
jgi:hypothetical protein